MLGAGAHLPAAIERTADSTAEDFAVTYPDAELPCDDEGDPT